MRIGRVVLQVIVIGLQDRHGVTAAVSALSFTVHEMVASFDPQVQRTVLQALANG